MTLPAILDPFARGAAATVMTRMALEWLIDDSALERLFEDQAQSQYTRELTLAHMVDLMLDVASGVRPSPRAAFEARWEHLGVSAAAFYGKLKRMEPQVSAAVVRHLAGRARAVIEQAGGLLDEPVAGYAARILDGNVLAGTEHRAKPLRGTRAAALPGKLLAVFEPASELVLDVVLSEDAYTQERALLTQVLPRVDAKDLFLADRNFCTTKFVFGIKRRDAFVVVRQHRTNLPCEPLGESKRVGKTKTGTVYEQQVRVTDPETDETLTSSRVEVRLLGETRDGDRTIAVLTNLPDEVSALVIADLYLVRWTIETHLQFLTQSLHCELPGLGRPRAALFGFAMALVASNALAVVRGSMRAEHGAEAEAEVSGHYLADEIAHDYRAVMKYLAADQWLGWRELTAETLAPLLGALAGNVNLKGLRRSRRGPKKPPTQKVAYDKKHKHYSTDRVLKGLWQEDSC